MKSLQKIALVSTVATYILIFIGGLVRVSGAGLGCPDWPKCFGRWIPPTDVSQLPSTMDPSRFNFTLAWIEYINRLCGVSVGILIAITAAMALIYARKAPRILWPAVAAGLLTAFQGWQGSVVISSELQPAVVTVHAVLALVIVSLLIWVTQQAYYHEHPNEQGDNYLPPSGPRWLTILWAAAIVQVILGTQMREGLEKMRDLYPLDSATQWVLKIGGISHIHMTLGLIVAVATWVAGRMVLRKSRRLTRMVRQAMVWAMILVGLQILSGLSFIFLGVPALVQVFHLWIASLFVGTLLIVFSAARRSRQPMGLEVAA